MFRRLKEQSGFSAIEVIVGMSLLVIIAAALGAQIGVSTITAQQSKERARALGLARAQADRIRSLDYRDISMPSNSQDKTQQQSDWSDLYCPIPFSADSKRCGADSSTIIRARSSADWQPKVRAVDVSVGNAHACAALSDGKVKCWGANSTGQLGNGTTSSSSTPVTVTGITSAVSVRAGTGFSCALLEGGTVQCWGLNGNSRLLGNGSTTNSSTPVQVTGVSGATQLATGQYHSCAVISDGTARCWGDNLEGQLGNRSFTTPATPVSVLSSGGSAFGGISQVTVGSYSSCARLTDGTARCWGSNDKGQLGTGNNTASNTPVAVSSLASVSSVSAGGETACALIVGGTLKCWGNNFGVFGNGSNTSSLSPVNAGQGISSAASLSVSSSSACAALSDGTARCWGSNSNGKLGDGSTTTRLTPVAVSGLNGAGVVASGSTSTCATRNDSTPVCWGLGTSGQIGNGATSSKSLPTEVSGFETATTPSTIDSWQSADSDPAVIGQRVDPRIGKQVERLGTRSPQNLVNTYTVNGVTLYTYIYWGGEKLVGGVPTFTPGTKQWKVIEVVARFRDEPPVAQFPNKADRARYSTVTVVQPVYDSPSPSQIPSS